MLRSLLLATLLLPTVWAQKYTGPKPPKADALYLLHAANLVPAEVAVGLPAVNFAADRS